MKVVDSGNCNLCGKEAAVVCDGCEMLLCVECRVFDIWSFGCGHGTTKAFCKTCYNDPEINVFRVAAHDNT